ncbi:hypothetical protein [Dyella sp. A6]|nr:hypothetical protein [Dyella sp. A6]
MTTKSPAYHAATLPDKAWLRTCRRSSPTEARGIQEIKISGDT